jgi:hypothetical protein
LIFGWQFRKQWRSTPRIHTTTTTTKIAHTGADIVVIRHCRCGWSHWIM